MSDLVSSGEAARRLGISQTYLARLAKAGTVACTETPLGRLYDEADVERLRLEREAVASAVAA